MNINNLLGNFGVKSSLTGDISFLILFLLLGFVLAVSLGRHRILVALLGVYVAQAVMEFAKFDFLKDANLKIILFLAILVGFVFIFGNIIRASLSGSGKYYMVKLYLASVILLGFSLMIIFDWLPGKEIAEFVTPTTRKLFTDDLSRFVWAAAPLAFLLVVRKRID